MKITIVLPTYNEKENVRELIPSIFNIFKKHRIKGHIIVVDDGSPDGTALEVKRLQKNIQLRL